MRSVIAAGLVGVLTAGLGPASASPDDAGRPPLEIPVPEPKPLVRITREEICRTIDQAAAENELPVSFFTRLIWQESRFNPHALSPKGAQGIAQFMPGTANWRGVADPFHPIEALQKAAHWLRELRLQFGNLGLAAAAYNGGPARVQNWLEKRGELPGETRAYVRIVTGRPAEDWASPEPPEWDHLGLPADLGCLQLARMILRPPMRPARERERTQTVWAPWGVQLAGDWSESGALASFRRLQSRYALLRGRDPLVVRVKAGPRASRHLVRIGEQSREAAESLCTKLRAAGGACVVLKNPNRTIANSVAGPSS